MRYNASYAVSGISGDPTPSEADVKVTRDLIRAAGEEAKKVADPSPDQRGSAEYKREMAGVLVARGLVATLGRLGVKVEA